MIKWFFYLKKRCFFLTTSEPYYKFVLGRNIKISYYIINKAETMLLFGQ
jgi:hypothetical protein